MLRHGKDIHILKLLLYAIYNFFIAALVQSNHIKAQYRFEQFVLNKKHLTSTKHLENFLNNIFTLAYNFLICLFKSTSELFVEIVMPRYLHCSTVEILTDPDKMMKN